MKEAPLAANSQDPAAKLTDLIRRVVELRAAVKRTEAHDSFVILNEALFIEADLFSWEASLPSQWRFLTVKSEEDDKTIYLGQYHVYSDLWIANMLNHYRAVRILVNEIILDQLSASPTSFWISSADSDLQKSQSLEAVAQSALNICRSVKFHLNPDMADQSHDALTNRRKSPYFAGVFILLWPLKLAASSKSVQTGLFKWIIELFFRLGHTMGIKLAVEYANSLAKTP